MADIGLQRGIVKLSPHNQNWKHLFELEKERLLKNFPDVILEISHGGSTAIPDISAKPIMDMFAKVRSLEDAESIKEKLESLGYTHRGEFGVPGRILYAKGPESARTHYVHFVEGDSDEWKNHILIRNYFLDNPDVAKEYEKLKISLAEQFKDDRASYTEGKNSFIKSIIEKAKRRNN